MPESIVDENRGAGKGLVDTWLLIGGSGAVAKAVRAVSRGARRHGVAWLLAAQGCGVAFLLFEANESAASFWHLVDLLWRVLFPLVCIVR